MGRRVYRIETKLASRQERCNLPSTRPDIHMVGTRSASLPETQTLSPTRNPVPRVEGHLRMRQTGLPRGILATSSRCLTDATKLGSN